MLNRLVCYLGKNSLVWWRSKKRQWQQPSTIYWIKYLKAFGKQLNPKSINPSKDTREKRRKLYSLIIQTLQKHKPYHTCCITALVLTPDGFVCLHITNLSVDNTLSKCIPICISCRCCNCSTWIKERTPNAIFLKKQNLNIYSFKSLH